MKTITIAETETINLIGAFADFKGMLVDYIVNNDVDLDLALTGCTICKLDEIHKALFMMYLYKCWNAYVNGIINGDYTYVDYTPMIYRAWINHMAQ